MVSVDSILGALVLESVGDDRYRAKNVFTGHPVVFGGQLLAQSIVAGLQGHENKTVKTLHTVFARSAAPDLPVEIFVDRIHSGRALASSTVTISQEDRLCARSMVLLSADEPDLIRHGVEAGDLSVPDGPGAAEIAAKEWTVQVVDGVDVNDPDAVGPPELDVWTCFVGAPDDAGISQALLAFATDGFLIGTAMRPHPGVGQSQAHRTISTGVLSHTVTFHEPFSAADWLLLAHRSVFAGHGRSYGRADVFRRDGQLVASYVQDSMIRAMAERQSDAQPM